MFVCLAGGRPVPRGRVRFPLAEDALVRRWGQVVAAPPAGEGRASALVAGGVAAPSGHGPAALLLGGHRDAGPPARVERELAPHAGGGGAREERRLEVKSVLCNLTVYNDMCSCHLYLRILHLLLVCYLYITVLCALCVTLQYGPGGAGCISPPLECIFGYIPFLRLWDTVRYSGIQLVQLDTYRYNWVQ